jgi:hypothetical protein
MPYDGLCSHSALQEGISGEKDGLTLEKINAKQVELDKIRKEKLVHLAQVLNPTRRATNLATEQFKRVDCDQLFSFKLDLDQHYTSQKHLDKAAGVKEVLREPKAPQYRANNIAKQKYHCTTCNRSFAQQSKLDRHYKTQKHLDNTAKPVQSRKSSS